MECVLSACPLFMLGGLSSFRVRFHCSAKPQAKFVYVYYDQFELTNEICQ